MYKKSIIAATIVFALAASGAAVAQNVMTQRAVEFDLQADISPPEFIARLADNQPNLVKPKSFAAPHNHPVFGPVKIFLIGGQDDVEVKITTMPFLTHSTSAEHALPIALNFNDQTSNTVLEPNTSVAAAKANELRTGKIVEITPQYAGPKDTAPVPGRYTAAISVLFETQPTNS